MSIHDVRAETRWFTTKSQNTWHVLTAGDRALCRSNVRPSSRTFSESERAAYWLPIPRCLPCMRRLESAAAPRTEVYDCPCCSETVMGDSTRVLCSACRTADCEANREGAHDGCQRRCEACGDPQLADFYVCVVVECSDGETDYHDGYVCADRVNDAVEAFTPPGATVLESTVSEINHAAKVTRRTASPMGGVLWNTTRGDYLWAGPSGRLLMVLGVGLDATLTTVDHNVADGTYDSEREARAALDRFLALFASDPS